MSQLHQIDPEVLIDKVYDRFRNRETFRREDIAAVVNRLDLKDHHANTQAPKLQIHKLRFSGEKKLKEGEILPFIYEQMFAPGVNIVMIPDNNVGKSSILKTIKFALTGDNSDYDTDVKDWISHVWLIFSINNRRYTSIISRKDGNLRGVLVSGEELDSLEIIVEKTSYFMNAMGQDEIKQALQKFFFHHLGLLSLSWTQTNISNNGIAERATSWLTYFQALLIPDSGDEYLICDKEHSMGNQDGLIISSFVGLSLAEPLNRLGVEARSINKEIQKEKVLSDEESRKASDQIQQLERKAEDIQRSLRSITTVQQSRRIAFSNGEPVTRHAEVQTELVAMNEEKLRLETERQQITETLKRMRSQLRRYEEQIKLKMHFTGLSVTLCPNCDNPVSEHDKLKEQDTHECRLCHKPAQTADAEEIAILEAEANEVGTQIKYHERGRDAINHRLAIIQNELKTLIQQEEILRQAVQQGISQVLATDEEESERDRLNIEYGQCRGEISAIQQRIKALQPDHIEADKQQKILQKVRTILQEEASILNEARLTRLSELTQTFVTRIGAESITEFSCSSLGVVQVKKHGKRVKFSGIKNQGERVRIKLAFFLALMLLGREVGLGRHPRFLLIDQPGTGEMVPEDFDALADILHEIDVDHSESLQIFCFTARPEFTRATSPTKVYSAQTNGKAF